MKHEFPDPTQVDSIVHNPSVAELRSFSADLETETEFGSPSYVSAFRSRSADRTRNAIDHDITSGDRSSIERAHRLLRDEPFVCVDRQLGRDPDLSFTCRLFVPRRYARIALAWRVLLDPPEGSPDLHTLQIPDWDGVRIRVFPDEGVTYVLGSDYTGEAKKSFLRLFMHRAKERGGLGLHAGSKRVTLDIDGERATVGQLFLGLSATGKTTLTCHDFGLTDPAHADLVQDDVCALLPDGSVPGSEGGGLYIKTQDLSPDEHAPLYRAATSARAVLENVAVDADGTVHFGDDSITRNGRAAVPRGDLPNAADTIDLDAVDHVFFITRNPLMPPIAKLTPAEAAAAFMLGESIQTSAGDPDRAGEATRVVGTNPFIIGPPGEEGNRFLDLVRDAGIECFLLNTGDLGGERDIGVEDTVALIRGVAAAEIEWRYDDRLGLRIPASAPGIDVDRFYPPEYNRDYDDRLAALRDERRAYLADYPELAAVVRDTPLAAPAR